MHFVICWYFSKPAFWKILSGIPSECQTGWVKIRPNNVLGLLYVQTVCKGYQQMTLLFRVRVGMLTVRNEILIFLFLNQNICCGYSKEPSQWDGSFEHPEHMFSMRQFFWKHMLNWWVRKYFQSYAQKFCLSKPMSIVQYLWHTYN